MKKKLHALLLSASLLLCGCAGNDAAETEIKLPIYGADEIRYEIAEAKYMDISQSTSVGATIGYPYPVHLTYPETAQVVSCDMVANRVVSAGDVLVELDSSALDYDINNQQTIVNNAYAASLTGGRGAQLNYEIQLLELQRLQAIKDSYTIRAPFDGILTSVKMVRSGDTVEKNAFCCSVSETEKVSVFVEGADAEKFRFGQTVSVKIDGKEYPAVVVEAPDIAPETAAKANRAVFDLGEGTFAQIEEQNPLALSAGWATVYVTEERRNVLAVPDAAVKIRGSEAYVTLVDGEERFKLAVTIGARLGGYTEIINGISEGDIVIAVGSGVYNTAE